MSVAETGELPGSRQRVVVRTRAYVSSLPISKKTIRSSPLHHSHSVVPPPNGQSCPHPPLFYRTPASLQLPSRHLLSCHLSDQPSNSLLPHRFTLVRCQATCSTSRCSISGRAIRHTRSPPQLSRPPLPFQGISAPDRGQATHRCSVAARHRLLVLTWRLTDVVSP